MAGTSPTITLEKRFDMTGTRCSARNPNRTSKLGQDARGLGKRNTGAAEGAVIHQKIEV
jgi:hypothetical protein